MMMNELYFFCVVVILLVNRSDSFLCTKSSDRRLNSFLKLKLSENSNNNDLQSRVAAAIALKAAERKKVIT